MGIGTPLHMAPEQWSDRSEGYGVHVDVYAYAVLLYSMFALDPLAHIEGGKMNRSCLALMTRIEMGRRFERVPGISDMLWCIIISAWDACQWFRPTFRDIVDSMTKNVHECLFPGADEAAVRKYIAEMENYRV
jgi:serine/threonine protein kinase